MVPGRGYKPSPTLRRPELGHPAEDHPDHGKAEDQTVETVLISDADPGEKPKTGTDQHNG